jgi:hypothetical protein
MAVRDPLYGIRLKLDRAKEQIQSLRDELAEFDRSEPYRLAIQYDEEARVLSAVVKIEKPIRGVWGVQVGEIIHNLRSALDHLVFELVIHCTGNLPTTHTQFPIFETEAGYNKRSAHRIAGVSEEVAALIRKEQPFVAGEDARSDPLWQLHELSNFDKHRTIHLTGVSLQGAALRFSGIHPGARYNWETRAPGPFKDDTAIMEITFLGSDWPFIVPVDEVEVQGPMRFDVAFYKGVKVVSQQSVIPALGRISSRVYETIKRISIEILGPL